MAKIKKLGIALVADDLPRFDRDSFERIVWVGTLAESHIEQVEPQPSSEAEVDEGSCGFRGFVFKSLDTLKPITVESTRER